MGFMSVDLWIEEKPHSGKFKKVMSGMSGECNSGISVKDIGLYCLNAKVTFEIRGELCEARPYHKLKNGVCILCGAKESP